MTRLDDAIAHLSLRGYSIKSIRSLSGGVNSAVFKLICSDGSTKVLKLYPMPTVLDLRKRGELEISFTSICIILIYITCHLSLIMIKNCSGA